MSTHTWKKCPYCGATYNSYTTYTKHYYVREGSPFVTCLSCWRVFIDKDIKEPALKPYSGSGYSILNCIFGFLFPFGIMGILLTAGAFQERDRVSLYVAAAILDSLYVGLTAYLIKKRKDFQAEGKAKYAESEKRLSDYKYALALKQAGFDVPSRFLNKGGQRNANIKRPQLVADNRPHHAGNGGRPPAQADRPRR